jgi:spermine oxidase
LFQFFQTYTWNKKVLLGWLSGDAPMIVNAMSDAELKLAVTVLFRRLFKNDSIPMPTELYRANWTSDVLYGGTFSYMSVAAVEANVTFKDLARPIPIRGVPRLLFAGEATHEHLYQTTTGAWLSGRREADRLREYYEELSHNCALNLHTCQPVLLLLVVTYYVSCRSSV